jgi:hypothetical protein
VSGPGLAIDEMRADLDALLAKHPAIGASARQWLTEGWIRGFTRGVAVASRRAGGGAEDVGDVDEWEA